MSEKTEYEKAVEAFEKADAEYIERQDFFESGLFLAELMAMCQGDLVKMQAQWKIAWGQLHTLLENRNTLLKTAQVALRQVAQLAPSQWRGPEGKTTTITSKGFTVNSVTSRTFDPQSLFALIQKHGLLERLMELEATNKDGVRYKVVQQSFDIDYESTLKWLKANKLDDVIDGAYDEKEKTPQVKGPKELAFLGDKKER